MIKLKFRGPLYFLRKTFFFQVILCIWLCGHAVLAQQADFIATSATTGCAPIQVTFAATQASTLPAGTIYSWKFGNTNTSVGSNATPGAQYIDPGSYDVELTVTLPGGATNTVVKKNFVVAYAKPDVKFSFTDNDPKNCAPLGVQFSSAQSTPGSGTINFWYWSFGDGLNSSDPNPLVTYDVSSSKDITLTLKNDYGCENSLTQAGAITVFGPKLDFNADQAVYCQLPATVVFDNRSTGDAPLTYRWVFGDGGTSTGASPTHNYNGRNLYHPALTVTDRNGCSRTGSVDVRTGSAGGLTVTPQKAEICIAERVGFDVFADEDILSYEWSFGDPSNPDSPDADPTVAYPKEGTYTVTLTAQLKNKNCKSVVSFPVKVQLVPTPSFNFKTDCNNNVTFTDKSTGAARVVWSIDNGAPFESSSFTRTMTSGGHNVTLVSYSALGCTAKLESTISVPAPPKADFTPRKDNDCIDASLSGCAPFTLTFKNKSIVSDSAYTLKWTFGDGTAQSTAKNPTYTYTKKGIYLVTLEVKHGQCSDKITRAVTVADVTPTAKFTFSKSVACAKEPINFTDQSLNANYWCWDFGDGQKSNQQNPVHAYDKPGVYDITLTAKNAGCSSTFTVTQAVRIKDPFVDFEFRKDCSNPYLVNIINKSDVDCDLYEWNFGDGQTATTTTPNIPPHAYAATGDYNLTLVGTKNSTQCAVKVEKRVDIYDIKAKFKVNTDKPCKGAPVTFTDESQTAASWSWDFGKGAPPDGSKNPTTSYDVAQSYTVWLTAADPDKCEDKVSMVINVLDITGDFAFNGTSDCTNLTAAFIDHSTAVPSIDKWVWDFGDNTPTEEYTSTDHTLPYAPTHVYRHTGDYQVTLTLTNNNGTCQYVKQDAVEFTVPSVDFKADKPGNCMNVPIQFTNQSFNARTYQWTFGDGVNGSTNTNPRFAYAQTGQYSVTLSATDRYNCTVPVTKPQYINITKPTASFTALENITTCPPLIPKFVDTSIGGVVEWAWTSGNGQQSTIKEPTFRYDIPGEYDVTLMVKDGNGCPDMTTEPKIIYVGGPYGTFSLAAPGPYCLNDSVTFLAQTTKAIKHSWDFGDGIVKDQVEANAGHRYKQAGSFLVSLILTDAQQPKPCTVGITERLQLQVNDTAKIDFKFPVCVFTGEESALEVTEPVEGLTYTWTVDGVAAGEGSELPVTMDEPGNHHIELMAMTPVGCKSRSVYEVPVQGDVLFVPNVFTPNDDGLNAEFQVVGVDRSTWDLKVFDRWGGPVFEQRDYKNTWKANGLATGVYYYLLKNAICPGREYKGIVSVIR